MSNRIPSRRERLRRAHESAGRIKDQWFNAEDVYDDVRDVIGDPTVSDFELPEAIERQSAETSKLEEEQRQWQREMKRLKETNMLIEQQMQSLEHDMQSSQLSDNQLDDITEEHLQKLMHLLEGHPNLAVLLFKDESHFQPAIQSIKNSGNQLLSKLHHLDEELGQIRLEIRETSKDYHDRLNDLVEPLKIELDQARDNLESVQTIQSSTNAELAKLKEELQEVTERYQASQDEIVESKAEISDLKKEAIAASRQNDNYQTEIEKLKSFEAINMRYLSTEIESVTSENDRAKARNTRLTATITRQVEMHNAEVRAITEAKNILSSRNHDQEAEIKNLEETLKELEENLSFENDQLQLQVQTWNTEKHSLSTQINQCENQIIDLKAANGELLGRTTQSEGEINTLELAKSELTTEKLQCQADIRALEAEKIDFVAQISQCQTVVRDLEAVKADLTSHNEEYLERIRALEGEKADLTSRNEGYQHQIQSVKDEVRALEMAKADLTDRNEDNQRQIQNFIQDAKVQLQREQEMQVVLFSNMLLLQGDQDAFLPGAGVRLFFKQQERSNIPTIWIKEPLGNTLDQLTNSESTAGLVKTYQLALQGLFYSHTNSDFPEALLSQLVSCSQWLATSCQDRISMLGLVLDLAVKIIEQGRQSEPWFSTSQFDAARVINSRNSDLPEGTFIIADGFPGVILIVQGMDVRILEACDVVIKQQEYSGFQLAFTGLDLPALQLLPNSWPGVSRWSVLCSWALSIGRINVVMKNGEIYEPTEL